MEIYSPSTGCCERNSAVHLKACPDWVAFESIRFPFGSLWVEMQPTLGKERC